MLPAFWHIQQPHFPQWVDLTHAEEEIREEVTERLRNKLKDAMFDGALQQENLRQTGSWTTRDMGEIEKIRVRLGKLHPR